MKSLKVKDFLSKPVLLAFFVSLLTVVVILGIIAGLLWHYRARVFKILATGYAAQEQALNPVAEPPTTLANATPTAAQIAPIVPSASVDVQDQASIVNSVKMAQPAVVSIAIYEDVPTYAVTYQNTDPSDGLIPGMSIQTPVYTQTGTQSQEVGGGSGFLISSDGLIVTNRHVVSDTDATYKVLLNNGKTYTGQVLARDPVLDVAFVKIAATGLPYLTLGNSDTLQVGQTVIAIGNALGQFKNTVSTGVVSGLSRSITAGDEETGQTEQLDTVIQTDAAINPGNSGGPLLNLAGDVIGINVADVEGSSNIGFALPINSLKSSISSVKKTGTIIRPYAGLRYVTITPDLQTQDKLPVSTGILVAPGATATDVAVIPGSPADKAGIVQGDIILSVDGQAIDDTHDFANLIRSKNIGQTIHLVVLSANGTQRTVSLTLVQAPTGM